MTLTVETGAIVANANSYVSIADCDSYHTLMGNATWTGTDAVKESAILRAMAWLEARPWKGIKYTYDQSLSWPRSSAVDIDGYTIEVDEVPNGVVKALCEAALLELVTPGSLRPSLERGGMVTSFTLVGVVSESYSGGAPAETVHYTLTGPLKGLLKSSNQIQVQLA